MKSLWSDKIRKIEPYVPGEQPRGKNIIKLNTNECPYPPSPCVKRILDEFDADTLRLYPSFECNELKEVLAKTHNVNINQIFLGNGSDEVIAFCFIAFFNSCKPILFPDITYSFYDVWCNLFNIKYEKAPLDSEFRIVKENYFKENGGVVIANPNAPTGRFMELNEIEEIIENNRDVIVLVDEAYIDFGGKSAVSLINKYDNLVVVHTFSKSRALAGIRLGYAVCGNELVQILESVKNSFNSYTVNALTQVIGTACVKDKEYFELCRNKIINTRERVIYELSKFGFKTVPSMSNFIFTTNSLISALELFEELKRRNIIVRYFNKPRISEYLRITVGTDKEMDCLIENIRDILRGRGEL